MDEAEFTQGSITNTRNSYSLGHENPHEVAERIFSTPISN
jgi:hypothetical protein